MHGALFTSDPRIRDRIHARDECMAPNHQEINERLERVDMMGEHDIETILDDLEKDVVDFVDRLLAILPRTGEKETILSGLYQIMYSPGKTLDEDIGLPSVPDDIILAQAHVSLLLASILHEFIIAGDGSGKCNNDLLAHFPSNPAKSLQVAFEQVPAAFYSQAFTVASRIGAIFTVAGEETEIAKLFVKLVDRARGMALNKALFKQDFIGKVFHKITGDFATRKGYATFYTKMPVASFLAFLALHSANRGWNIDWGDLEQLARFRVCDFACGSGTLLSATYNALLEGYKNQSAGKNAFDAGAFHRVAIENVIWGFDALEHALQTASLVLVLHEPETTLNQLQLYHAPVASRPGVRSKHALVGSLELWDSPVCSMVTQQKVISNDTEGPVDVPCFDFIIMNPPFARSTAPGKQGSRPRIFDFSTADDAFRALWDRYGRVLGDMENHVMKNGIVHDLYRFFVENARMFKTGDVNPLNAGSSLPFVFLSDRYLKDGGRLALVLPKTVIESAAYFLVRALVLSSYHVEYLVVSNEPGNNNFSHSSQFSEILMVLRKARTQETHDRETRIVKFFKQPASISQSIALVRKILDVKGNALDRVDPSIEITTVDQDALHEFTWNWSVLTDLPGPLLKIIRAFLAGDVLGSRVATVSLAGIKVAGKDVMVSNPRTFRGKKLVDNFSFQGNGNCMVLREAGKSTMTSLVIKEPPLERASPVASSSATLHGRHAGHVFIPEAVRFNTLPLVAGYSSEPFISSVGMVIDLHEPEYSKAVVAWLNSTISLIMFKPMVSSVFGNFGHVRGWHLKTVKVPDITDPTLRKGLAAVFEKYGSREFDSLPIQYERVLDGTDTLRLDYDVDVVLAVVPSARKGEIVDKLMATYASFVNILQSK